MEGIIRRAIDEAIQFGRISDSGDVVAIKELQVWLKDNSNIDIEYSTLRRRVQEAFEERVN